MRFRCSGLYNYDAGGLGGGRKVTGYDFLGASWISAMCLGRRKRPIKRIHD